MYIPSEQVSTHIRMVPSEQVSTHIRMVPSEQVSTHIRMVPSEQVSTRIRYVPSEQVSTHTHSWPIVDSIPGTVTFFHDTLTEVSDSDSARILDAMAKSRKYHILACWLEVDRLAIIVYRLGSKFPSWRTVEEIWHCWSMGQIQLSAWCWWEELWMYVCVHSPWKERRWSISNWGWKKVLNYSYVY